jgi:hypothetical protein
MLRQIVRNKTERFRVLRTGAVPGRQRTEPLCRAESLASLQQFEQSRDGPRGNGPRRLGTGFCRT